jgi:DNA invertase Pin-like site-specific DNA recombinase
MGDKAGIWLRVSTGGQDEANQLPDNMRWCETHGYDVKKTYTLHGKSASKGKQDKHLDEVIRDMQDGTITVLIVWQSSRIERRGAYSVFDLARRVREAGGRIEYVEDTYLNDTNEMSDVMLALAATKDRQKSRDISKQVKAAQAKLRAVGSAVGRAPWGYEIATVDGKKIFAPTDHGRRWIPEIFRMTIDGMTLREIAEHLDARGVCTQEGNRWNETVIGSRIIKNPVYYGARRNSGSLETESLVSFSVWSSANAVLASRARGGRSAVINIKAMLAPVCGNPACDATGRDKGASPMYRVYCGQGDKREPYYRCAGRGPQRKGCGNMVQCADLDERVMAAMLADQINQRLERVFVPGDTRADEIGKLREAAMTAYRAGDKARFLELDAEADSLAELPAVRPHWTTRETGQSEGDYFAALDDDARRSELAENWIITADNEGSEVTVTIGRRTAPATVVAS